jgi:hypothetical protein
MISIFPLWTFHLYVARFQKHLHMEYKSLWWSDIPFQSSWFRSGFPCSLRGSYWTKSFNWSNWSHASDVYGHHLSWLTFTNICVTNDNGYVPLVLIPSQSFFVIRVARWVPLVDQELFSLLRHLSYPLAFSRIRVAQSLVFCVVFCWSLFALLSFCVWPLCCLSFDLRNFITPLISSNSS